MTRARRGLRIARIGGCGDGPALWTLDEVRVHIRLAEALGPRFAAAFDDLEVRTETVLTGEVSDRAALHGVLARVRDLDLVMVDVRVEEDDHIHP